MLFRDNPDFGPTLNAAAGRIGISATAVEKDYWVSQALRALAREHGESLIFKGGTSLSKALRLIERFSEDVDLLIRSDNRGRAACDALMKNMKTTVESELGGPSTAVGGSERGRHRAYRVEYPALHPPTLMLQTSVLLEMGIRGGTDPSAPMAIGSLLGDLLSENGVVLEDYADLAEFSLQVLHPGRTLLEKFSIVHLEAKRLEADEGASPKPNLVRHFYDVHQLLMDPSVVELLSDREATLSIIEDIRDTTVRYFNPGTPDLETCPSGGFAASPAFDEVTSASQRLGRAYEESMGELFYGKGTLPSWSAVCERVKKASI